ncbi:hypothetical protein [Bradyrhizobium sp. RDI18]|uniref:hypothetical protein n=1 Tax=Bradyrhizobium sp. RDI18 TaxID=3367400 RepID=UPI0037234CF1
MLQEATEASGLFDRDRPSFANVARDYWQMSGESLRHFGERLAEELGGYFKVAGKTAYFREAPDLSGGIEAVWGKNLIEWRVRPYIARTSWGGSEQDHYNIAKGLWDKTLKNFGEGSAITSLPFPAPNAKVAGQANDGAENFVNATGGVGGVMINGEPQARAGMVLTISGAREDVDGTYVIDEAHHRYERGGGYTTLCKLRFPNAKARVGNTRARHRYYAAVPGVGCDGSSSSRSRSSCFPMFVGNSRSSFNRSRSLSPIF